MYSETKTNIVHNIEYNAKINIKRETPLKELLNFEKRNNSRVKCHKRKQELLNNDKGKHVKFNIIFTSVTLFK